MSARFSRGEVASTYGLATYSRPQRDSPSLPVGGVVTVGATPGMASKWGDPSAAAKASMVTPAESADAVVGQMSQF